MHNFLSEVGKLIISQGKSTRVSGEAEFFTDRTRSFFLVLVSGKHLFAPKLIVVVYFELSNVNNDGNKICEIDQIFN